MKDLLLLIAITVFSIPLISQTEFKVHAGPSMSWMHVDGISTSVLPERSPALTWQAGIGVETVLHQNFSFVSGLDFAQRGFTSTIEENIDLFRINIPVGAEAITTLDYLSIPLKIKYQTGGEAARFYVDAGPRFGYAIDGRVKTRAKFLVDINTGTYDLDPSGNLIQAFEAGGEIGTGIEWKMPKGNMHFGVQYYHSFTNALNDPILAVDFRNRSLTADLGYTFKF